MAFFSLENRDIPVLGWSCEVLLSVAIKSSTYPASPLGIATTWRMDQLNEPEGGGGIIQRQFIYINH